MLGAIAGDIIGSIYEGRRRAIKTEDFPLFQARCHFTDDTVMTVAVAEAILTGQDYGSAMKRWGRKYPHAGYGRAFKKWIWEDGAHPYYSWGNGSAMRVCPIGLAFDDVERVLLEAQRSAEVSHDHPEGIKGAQAVALAVLLARFEDKETIRAEISRRFGYDLQRTVADIRPDYQFQISCQLSVPESIIAFLDSWGFEDAVRKAVSLGGDADTQAAITGGIAEAHYGLPAAMVEKVYRMLPRDIRQVVDRFNEKFKV